MTLNTVTVTWTENDVGGAGLSGTVTEVNDALSGDPGLVNREPYTTAWMIKIELSDPAQVDSLLDAATYEAFIAEEGGH